MLFLVKSLTLLLLIITCESSPGRHTPSSKLRSANSRLPGNVRPSNYVLSIILDENFYTTNTFSGIAVINLSINTTEGEDIESFVFHAKDLSITNVTLTRSLNNSLNHIGVYYSTKPNPETDFVTVTSAYTNLTAGDGYQLVIHYTGKLSETSMTGFYKSTYVDENQNTKYLASTQFEETHARTAFPCFDEPEMKATFEIMMTYPVGYSALSILDDPYIDQINNPNLTRVIFGRTPPMSTYLVAFIVSEFNCKAGGTTSDGTKTQVCSRMRPTDATLNTALDTASTILDIMHDYTNNSFGKNTSRYNSRIEKVTLAAIPDFAPGAMENWGLVTFREANLLIDEDEASNYDKQRVVTMIAHELSHQWFGDLVTLNWWSDVFLNEGFATFFEYHAAALYQTEWELEKQFVIEQLQTALVIDSLDTALPLSYDIDNADYSSRFDDISYNKGGSILRMVYHFLGDLNFKNGLADYVSQNAHATATPDILWASFDPYAQQLTGSKTLPANMTTVMDNWTTKPGYPLLRASASGNDIVIKQEPFFLSGNLNDTEWYVPVTYTLSNFADGFVDTSIKAWLNPGEYLTLSGVLADIDWVVLNNQQVGYYRVDYDNTLWTKISNALQSNLSNIDELSRAQIVDDQLNFARGGRKTYENVFSALSFLKNDDSYYTWSAAFNGFSYLLQRTKDEDVKKALSEYILEQMSTLIAAVPIEQENADDQIYTLKQVLALTWSCKVGNEECTSVMKQKFLDYKSDDSKKPSSNFKSIVYCNGLRYSDSPTEDFRFLWQKYLDTQLATERVTILKALGCVNNNYDRNFYLSTVLTDKIRRQDASYVFASVYSNHPEGVVEVLNFIIAHHDAMVTYFGKTSTLTSVINSVAEHIVTQTQYNKLETIVDLEDLDTSVKTSVAAALAKAKANLEVTQKLDSNFKGYFGLSSSAPAGSNLITLLFATMSFLFITLY